MNIGIAIRIFRTEKGWTHSELSEKSGIPETRISEIENGVIEPDKKHFTCICDAFQVSEKIFFLYCLEEKDVHEKKKETFNAIFPKIQEMLIQVVKMDDDESDSQS